MTTIFSSRDVLENSKITVEKSLNDILYIKLQIARVNIELSKALAICESDDEYSDIVDEFVANKLLMKELGKFVM